MICALALLFGVGGTALVSASFDESLSWEKRASQDAYRMLTGALQVLSERGTWENTDDIAGAIGRMQSGAASALSYVQLSREGEVLYGGSAPAALRDSLRVPGHFTIQPSSGGGRRYLQLSGQIMINSRPYDLYALRDVTHLYDVRAAQLSAYHRIYALLVAGCAALSYALSGLMLRPVKQLAHVSRRIADGDLKLRADVRTGDEIGRLALDFNAMADRLTDEMKRQDMFVANFTHELKTPLTSIIGYAELLRGQSMDAGEQLEALNYIYSEGRRLERMSMKLLDIYVADGGRLRLRPASPAAIARRTVNSLRADYRSRGIDINCECEEGMCLLEPDLVQSLLNNLIDNARKACSDHGRIFVRVRLTDSGCEIEVADNGRGIPRRALKHLTEAFYRVDKARSRELGGAGLGLTLCLKIARLHSGELRINSAPGSGTAITAALNGGRA